MTNDKIKNDNGFSKLKAVAFSTGLITEQAAYQSFTVLVFVFYYAIVGIPIILITMGFVLWAFWNMINDPLLGWFSDRTHTKYGRRLPYIMIAIFPLALVMFFLFTPPMTFGLTDITINFIYFFVIIVIFELFFSMFSLNATALFPEVFITKEERISANSIRESLIVVGLGLGIILPGLLISDYSDPASLPEFRNFGVVIAVIISILGLIFIKFTPKEKAEFQDDYKNTPGFFDSIKFCLKNKSFMWYIPAEIGNWFVYTMLATVVPLYGKFVLGITDALLLSLLLAVTFLSAAIFVTLLWRPVVRKLGNRKAWLLSMSIWIITLIPLMFLGEDMYLIAVIIFFFIGIGLAGSLYIIDLVISDIVDEDALNKGVRREAGYYGVNAFFLRLSAVFVFLAIGPLFIIADWAVFDPNNITPEIIFMLKSLMSILPIIALIIAILAIYKYPLHGEKLDKISSEIQKLNEDKKSKL